LSAFSQAKNAILKFECISGMGGSLNIDNINLGAKSSGIAKPMMVNVPAMYPNPANQLLTIHFNRTEDSQLKIFDEKGKIVLEYSQKSGEEIVPFDISHLNTGFYFVEISSASQKKIQKLSIVR